MIMMNNNFTYGEIGGILNGNKNNQIYQNSAISIKNAIIGEAGTIRAIENFDKTRVIDSAEEIIAVLTTKFDFYVVITDLKIYTVSGTTVIDELNLNSPINDIEKVNSTVFADTYAGIVEEGNTQFYKFNDQGSDLAFTDFLKDANPPLDNRKRCRIDVHRVYEIEEVRTQGDGTYTTHRRKTIERLQSLEDPLVEVTDNKMSIEGLAGTVARMYGEPLNQFRLVTTEHSTGEITEGNINVGDIIVNFPNGIPTDLIFKNVIPQFTGDEEENSLTYYTNFEAPNGEGRLVRGNLIDLSDKITSIAEYQSRLIFGTDNALYFSGINQYQNFTNYTEDDDPFWIKIPPIDNQPTAIVSLFSSRTLFILTNKGIYTMGVGQVLTPRTSSTELATDTGATKKATMVDGNLFFIGMDERLYSIQELRDTAGIKMYSYIVEKYNFDTQITWITTIRYEKRNRLLAFTGTNKLHIYDIIGTDEFRRTTSESSVAISKAWGMFDKMFSGGEYYENSGTNKELEVNIHPPFVMAQEGSLLNDKNIIIDSITISVLGDATIFINDKKIPKKNDDPVFTLKTHIKAYDGIKIRIESTNHAELLSVEYNYQIAGRY